MKRTFVLFLAVLSYYSIIAQPNLKGKKYPSLLWEISGNGLTKPSYLIGTMHVSSKMAFHLPDSFYYAVKNAQVVALETNPETWQEDMSKYDLGGEDYKGYGFGNYTSIPNEYLSINTLRFYKYDKKIERSLYSNPSTINNLLYRSFGNASSDFEEDTYLDMYIYQCGKKWGKRVTGVENYGESMRLMTEAYKDAAKDKNKKKRSYDGDEDYSSDKIQEAYRSGNLDLLDSINRYNSFSDAFDEKFLYKRNEIQVRSIDSIIRSGSSLFAGVGAAHLPGTRGVIELLRKKGYKLRPVKMGERDSRDKEQVDKIRVPVIFKTETADDGLFQVDIPGKFYKMGDDGALDQRQYADMSNGSYYMVTRIMTNAWMWGHNSDDVNKAIDSLLYENIPGKIISKIAIVKNGYKGLDITNRTRRGDLQRYNIFITPFEIIFFKISGNGEYIKNGDEAARFFGSIQFKEYKNSSDQATPTWKKYSPPYGGFAVDFPHEPYVGNDGSWIYDSEDKTTGTHYRIIRSDIHNFHFVEEDSFDLSLMDESFRTSDFIDTQLLRKQTNYKGYPAMDCKYKDNSGSIYLTRFIIQGPHYFTLVAFGKKETSVMHNFLNSFEIKPFVYKEAALQKDTSLYFTVNTPVFPEDKKIKLGAPRNTIYGNNNDDDDQTESEQLQGGVYRNKIISNDSTGEKIYVSFYHPSRYYYSKDTAAIDKKYEKIILGDTSWVIKSRKKTILANGMKVWETVVTDTGSSRILWTKVFYKNGISFSLATESDTLTQPSAFVKNFYETFLPADTLKETSPFIKKSNFFFADFLSNDSVRHKLAVKHIYEIDIDSADFPELKKVVSSLNWNEKKYLDTKKSLIGKLGNIQTNAAADYLKDLYYVAGDTVELQYIALESLLQQQTAYSFNVFRDIISAEPPVLDANANNSYFSFNSFSAGSKKNNFNNGSFLDELFDSLQLTKTILPDLLPLLNLDDYKQTIMQLLGEMVDSSLLKSNDYDAYFNKFMIEAKQELRKQAIAEKKKAIEKAEEDKKDNNPDALADEGEEKDYGNDDLSLYATLLLPWWQINSNVQPLIQKMLQSEDKKLKYSIMLLLIRNNKPYADSLLTYFASLDNYRFDLYTDLKELKKLDKFPGIYFNHLDLGISSLIDKKSSGKPDSLLYLDRLKTVVKGKKGFVYFYKYKTKKDDLTWKLAMVGLVPEDPKKFEFDYENKIVDPSLNFSLLNANKNARYNLTRFTDTKIDNNEPLELQLNRELKKILYSLHKSGKEFYEDSDSDDDLSRRFSFSN